MTQWAAFVAIAGTAVWAIIGVTYFVINSITAPSALLPYSSRELSRRLEKWRTWSTIIRQL
jgi:hypothetical protein